HESRRHHAGEKGDRELQKQRDLHAIENAKGGPSIGDSALPLASSKRVTQRCNGGRVHPGRDYASDVCQTSRGVIIWTIRTVYRKESRPCGEAARSMRGNHLGSLSYSRVVWMAWTATRSASTPFLPWQCSWSSCWRR